MIDLSTAQSFLRAIAPSATNFHFRTFSDAAACTAPARKFHGTLDQVAENLDTANKAGAGVFVVVNEGGDTDASITGVRAVFLDIDRNSFHSDEECESAIRYAHEGRYAKTEAFPEDWPRSSLLVRSGGGGAHVYWKVENCPVDRFKAVQRALAAKFKGDPKVSNLSRVMRLPGTLHRKDKPEKVVIEICRPDCIYRLDDLLHWLGVNEEAPRVEPRASDFGAGRPITEFTVTALRAALKRIDQHDPDAVHDRTTWLKVLASTAAHGWGDLGKQIAREWSSQSDKFDADRFEVDWHSLKTEGGISASTVYWLASSKTDCPAAHTDDGAACRFAQWLGGRVMFARGILHVWSGAYWQPNDMAVSALLKDYAREAAKAALDAFLTDPEGSGTKANKIAAEKLLNTTKQFSVLQALRVILHVEDSVLDRDPYLLACANGTVDLRTGILKPADPLDYITQCTGHPYVSDATAPRWERFLKDAIGDEERIDWFQRFLGYSTSGDVREDLLLLTTGPGGSGKTTALNAVMHALSGGHSPHGYATVAASALLSASANRRNANEHTAGLIPLIGKRLAAVNEVAVAERWDDSVFKQLVSTEPMLMRACGGTHNFPVQVTWKIWVRGNHTPVIRDNGSGFWRRMAILEFASPPEVKNLKLDEDLRAEATGILNWLVRGCLKWQRRGLARPDRMLQALAGFQADQDVLAEWQAACTEAGGSTPSADLLDSYMRFTRSRKRPSPKAWGAMLKEKGIESTKNGKGIRGFALTLLPDPDFPDGADS